MLAGGNSGESSICVATPANLIGDSMAQIKLTQGKYTLVDDDLYGWLNRWKWYALKGNSTYYARRNVCKDGKRETIRMHRLILGARTGEIVDHQNLNGLDNRRCNIRLCTKAQNKQNSRPVKKSKSRYKGVTWHKNLNKWMASIMLYYRSIHIGYYKTEVEAAKAYDAKAKKLFGEYAYLNFR